MNLTYKVVGLLRVVLVVLFAGLVVGQTMSFPGQFAHMAQESPEMAYLRWPLTVFAVLELLCIQVVIVCIWKLLTMVKADRIFSKDAFGWVDGIVWAIAAGWLLFAAAAATITGIIYFTPELRDPGTPILLFGMTLLGSVLVMLMVVMRALLRQAAALRSDMDEVI